MAEENNKLISLQDIQNLVIEKKFVRIDSNKYTQEAYDYVKQLIDNEKAILFDRSTHRIWTLGEWFGGDVFKENLMYYSKLKAINVDNTLIKELEALGPEQTLAYKGKNSVKVNISRDDENKQDVVEIDLDVYKLINSSSDGKFSLYVNKDGKIDIHEYVEPNIKIKKKDHILGQTILDLDFEVESTVPIEDWVKFDVLTQNCSVIEVDKVNKKLKLQINPDNYANGIDEVIKIQYNDGFNEGEFIINGIFNVYCYYGCYNPDTFKYIDTGNYIIENNKVDGIFGLNQYDFYYGYFRCPKKYSPLFVDNIRYSQGAWHKEYDVIINEVEYNTYITDNSGLGNIQWKVIENIK